MYTVRLHTCGQHGARHVGAEKLTKIRGTPFCFPLPSPGTSPESTALRIASYGLSWCQANPRGSVSSSSSMRSRSFGGAETLVLRLRLFCILIGSACNPGGGAEAPAVVAGRAGKSCTGGTRASGAELLLTSGGRSGCDWGSGAEGKAIALSFTTSCAACFGVCGSTTPVK